jgi:hypothetical protein
MIHNGSNQTQFILRTSLPNAAQRWLDRALPQGLDLPTSIRLEKQGSMDIRGRWTSFKATGEYKSKPLSFNWRARFRLSPGVWITAEDGHSMGQGWGSARLWGIIPMGKRTNPEVLFSQVVRNFGELPWLPSFALINPDLEWIDLNETSFEVRYAAGEKEAIVQFEINDQGDIMMAISPARPYDVPSGYAEAPWYYEFSDHLEFRGMLIPAAAAATFDKGGTPWKYFQGRVTSLTFDATEK